MALATDGLTVLRCGMLLKKQARRNATPKCPHTPPAASHLGRSVGHLRHEIHHKVLVRLLMQQRPSPTKPSVLPVSLAHGQYGLMTWTWPTPRSGVRGQPNMYVCKFENPVLTGQRNSIIPCRAWQECRIQISEAPQVMKTHQMSNQKPLPAPARHCSPSMYYLSWMS